MYKVGDDVAYSPKNIKARIVKVLPNDEYRVEFYDKDLIPPQMDVPGNHLELQLEDYYDSYNYYSDQSSPATVVPINKETHCPRCGIQWKETVISGRYFYDCLECVLRKEDA